MPKQKRGPRRKEQRGGGQKQKGVRRRRPRAKLTQLSGGMRGTTTVKSTIRSTPSLPNPLDT